MSNSKHLPDWDEKAFRTLIPAHLQGGLRRYFEDRIKPGSFLTAILENDYVEATNRADLGTISLLNLQSINCFLFLHAPSKSHGNPTKVSAWLAGEI